MPRITSQSMSESLNVLLNIPTQGAFTPDEISDKSGMKLGKVKKKISQFSRLGIIERVSAGPNGGSICKVVNRPAYDLIVKNIKFASENNLEVPACFGHKFFLRPDLQENLPFKTEDAPTPEEEPQVTDQIREAVQTKESEDVQQTNSDDEVADFWGEAGRPCKDIARRETLVNLAGANAEKIRSAFDLPGIDLISTEYILEHYDCSLFAAEREHSIYKEIKEKPPFANQGNPPRHMLINEQASKAIQKLFRYNVRPFDLVNLDFCGYYCPQTEKTLNALFGNDMINHGAYLFVTLSSSGWRRADYRALLASSYESITGERHIGENPLDAFPLHVARLAFNHGYIAELKYNKYYREPSADTNPAKPTMHVFGFLVTRPLSLIQRVQIFTEQVKALTSVEAERIVPPKK